MHCRALVAEAETILLQQLWSAIGEGAVGAGLFVESANDDGITIVFGMAELDVLAEDSLVAFLELLPISVELSTKMAEGSDNLDRCWRGSDA